MSKGTSVEIVTNSVNQVALFGEETVETGDTLWNTLVGKYDIALDDLESIEDGSEDLAVRLLGYFRRRLTGKKIREEKEKVEESDKTLSEITDVVGKDAKAVAMYTEKESKSFLETSIHSARDVLIGGYRSIKNIPQNIIEGVDNAKKNPASRVGTGSDTSIEPFIDSIQGPVDVEKIADDATKTIETAVKDTVNNTKIGQLLIKIWKIVEAGSDFFYIACALIILGKFDFILQNTYATFLAAIVIVYIIRSRS